MKKEVFLLIGFLCSIAMFGQSKFYINPEISVQQNITQSAINLGLNNQPYLKYGINIGYNLSESVALETGLGWSQIPEYNSYFGIEDFRDTPRYSDVYCIVHSESGLFSVPFHLKLSNSLKYEKTKMFLLFGPRLLFGNLKSEFLDFTEDSMEYSTIKTNPFFNVLFDIGIGVEYEISPRFTVFAKLTYSVGVNSWDISNPDEIQFLKNYEGNYATNKWKGDQFGFSMGIRYRF